jgi:hypothetical protein
MLRVFQIYRIVPVNFWWKQPGLTGTSSGQSVITSGTTRVAIKAPPVTSKSSSHVHVIFGAVAGAAVHHACWPLHLAAGRTSGGTYKQAHHVVGMQCDASGNFLI